MHLSSRLFTFNNILVLFLALFAFIAAGNANAADDSPLVFYNFSEGSGAVVRDSSGYGSPLDLKIDDTASTRWLSGGGLEVRQPALIASAGAATKIIDAVKKTNELTVEAWIDPANTTQSGPARIVTLSRDSSSRNFTLGQESALYHLRMRSTTSSNNGKPYLRSADGTLSTGLTHVVYTRSVDGIARLYMNGVQQSKNTVGGDLGNWDDNFKFALANELTGERPWVGVYYQVAVYSQAFSATDVDLHYAAGPEDAAGTAPATSPTQDTSLTTTVPAVERIDSPLVFYNFSEGSGAVVRDSSGYGSPLDLKIDDTASTRWLSGGGLEVHKPALIASAGAATKIIDAVKKTNELTVEAWIDPANTAQSGPARIVTLSRNAYKRNYTLGQESALYNVRLRSTATDNNGKPYLRSPDGTLSIGLTHVVYTRSADGIARVYINGAEQSKRTVGGNLGNWDDNFKFALANELNGDRPWVGRYYQVAVYSQAFSATDVDLHYAAGPEDAAGGGDTSPASNDSSLDTSVSTSQLGVANLSWQPPVARTDGSALSVNEINGYTLYYGQSVSNLSNSLKIDDASRTSVTVTDLRVGTWYFAVTARDLGDRESSHSSIAIKLVY